MSAKDQSLKSSKAKDLGNLPSVRGSKMQCKSEKNAKQSKKKSKSKPMPRGYREWDK